MNEYRKREEQDLRIFLSYKNPYTKEISPNLDEKIKFYKGELDARIMLNFQINMF